MKLIIVTLLATCALGFNFDLVPVSPKKSVKTDSGKDLPFMEDMRALSESFSSGNYLQAIPAGMSLLSNLTSYAKKQSPVLQVLLDSFGGKKCCPYIKCVKKNLRKACKVGRLFVHALFIGDKEKAKKLLKCLDAILNQAIECKKDK